MGNGDLVQNQRRPILDNIPKKFVKFQLLLVEIFWLLIYNFIKMILLYCV